MVNKDLNVRVTASSEQFERGMKRATQESRKFERELAKQQRAAEQFKENTGRAMLGAGLAILAGVGLSVKAAVQWETAWTGVTKTVDGSAEEMAKLEGQLRQLARELPATHTEIAAVAEAAGQLGVQRENIASFTRTMIDLGETTSLSAEEAATSLARFSNIMGTSQQDVDKLGSVLVQLGNNAATTEGEILELGTRLAAAGKIAGLSESDVFAFASTLTSVGVKAEAGGTALSKVFTKISDSVIDGGEELDIFAKVAGTTTEQFARDFERDPAKAIASFIAGLGRMNEAGESTTGVFEDLGLNGERLKRALLSTAGAGDMLTDQLALANGEWETNTALVEEAAKRYETTESQMKIARGAVEDLGISLGETLLPVLGSAAEQISGLVLAIQNLPEPVKKTLGVLGFAAGAIATMGGAALLAGPRIAKFRAASAQLATTATGLNRGLGRLGTFLTGPWGAAIAGATIAAGFFASQKADAALEVESFVRAIEADNGALEENARLTALKSLQDREMTDDLKAAGIPLNDAVTAIIEGGEAYDLLVAKMVAFDEAKERESKFLLGHAVPAWHQATRAIGLNDQGITSNERKLNGITGSIADANQKSREQGEVVDESTEAWQANEEAVDEATQALEDYIAEVKKATDPMFALFSALESVDSAQKAYNKAVKKYGQDSPQARKAAIDVAKAVAQSEQAALDGDLSFKDFRAQLKRWTKEGVITADQAKAIEGRVKNARKEAERYEGDYEAKIKADVRQATRELDQFIDKYSGREILLHGGLATDPTGTQRRSGGLTFAAGGPVRGPGGPRDDQVPAWLSDGEFVVNAMQAGRHWQLLDAINRGRLPAFAEGGPVTLKGAIDLSSLERAASRLAASMTSATGTAGGAARWTNVALAALAYTGMPSTWIGSLLRRMNQESGGNPFAINLSDSNAMRGDPSRGLMQTIMSTFSAYARELAGRGIYDPFANIVASIRYANSRYGSAPVGWNQPGGYDTGGFLQPGWTPVWNGTGKREAVLDPRQTAAVERLARTLDTNRTTASSIASVHIDYTRLGDSVANALHRKGVRITGGKLSGKLDIGPGRNGGIVGMMRDVAAEEARDEADWRRG